MQREPILCNIVSYILNNSAVASPTPSARVSPITQRRSFTPHPRPFCRSRTPREYSSTIGISTPLASLLDLSLDSVYLIPPSRILDCPSEALRVEAKLPLARDLRWTHGGLQTGRFCLELTDSFLKAPRPSSHSSLHGEKYWTSCRARGQPLLPSTTAYSWFPLQIPQLYVSLPASTNSPPRVLKGFDSVFIAPGKSQVVTIQLSRFDVALWNVVQQRWQVPSGTIGISIGASSRDIRLSGSL